MPRRRHLAYCGRSRMAEAGGLMGEYTLRHPQAFGRPNYNRAGKVMSTPESLLSTES